MMRVAWLPLDSRAMWDRTYRNTKAASMLETAFTAGYSVDSARASCATSAASSVVRSEPSWL